MSRPPLPSHVLALLTAFVAAACSVPSVPSPLSCAVDTDCPADAHCHDAACVADLPPVASISGPGTAAAGAAITFDGSASADGDDDVAAWIWSVRVLSATCPPDLGTTGVRTFQPVFACAGQFEVILVVRDQTGVLSAPAILPVTITAG